jgi:repressor LexA
MISERAKEILAYVRRSTREKGYPPTIREIGEAFGISSTNGVRYHLNLLEKAGHLKRQGRISRGIEAPGGGIPLLGRVAAGQPTLAEESFDGSLEPSEVFGNREGLFALRVKGDSMIEAGILEGDYVIVRAQQNATAGQMVVGMIDGEATVKFYQPKKDRIELVPANSRYEPIVVQRAADFSILGIVKGVIRTVR